ncbi:MAG: hypothetical protein NC131_14910 [Roseburia sp.]|nr:hypothetical protein [Roseburia sp.]
MDISSLKQITLDGFQVVNSSLFSSMSSPTMTIWPDSVSFSQAAFAALNNCEAVSVMVNNKAKSIIISTVPSNSTNAVLWRKSKGATGYRKLSCSTFARQLFEEWGLDSKARYRTIGRMVQVDKKVMLLFEFENAEKWLGDKAVK